MREKARHHLCPLLWQYLEAEGIETKELTTQCPCCGKRALLNSDDTWSCFDCEARGDVLDYDMHLNPELSENESAKHIREMLGLKVLELNTVEGNALMDMEFKPAGFLIEKLIGKGVYILAGASKIGKSWLVLWLADCVSKGVPVWDLKTSPLRSAVCQSRRYTTENSTAAQ